MSKFDKVMEHMQQHEVVELAASLVRIPGHYKVSGGETAVAEAESTVAPEAVPAPAPMPEPAPAAANEESARPKRRGWWSLG